MANNITHMDKLGAIVEERKALLTLYGYYLEDKGLVEDFHNYLTELLEESDVENKEVFKKTIDELRVNLSNKQMN